MNDDDKIKYAHHFNVFVNTVLAITATVALLVWIFE